MKATIDQSGCIGCGVCSEICPEVFEISDDDLADVIVDEIPAEAEGTAQEAAESCPVSVILVE